MSEWTEEERQARLKQLDWDEQRIKMQLQVSTSKFPQHFQNKEKNGSIIRSISAWTNFAQGTGTIAGRHATGKTVSLPFTMKELTDIYMSLQTADEREAFWKELNEKIQFFTDEQKALFVISWSESLNECLVSADKTIEASRRARTAAAQAGWTFPAE